MLPATPLRPGTLTELYAMRLADRDLAFGMRWIPFESCLVHKDGAVILSAGEYMKRLVMANDRYVELPRFYDQFSKWKNALAGDPRNHIRGHDFVLLLVWTIRKFGGMKKFAAEDAVQRLFVII